MTEHQVAKALQHAAKLIEDRGWIQGAYGNRELGYCSIGALDTVAEPEIYYAAIQRLNLVIPETFCNLLDHGVQRIIEYNDTPGRTRDEVLQAFRKAAGDEQAQ